MITFGEGVQPCTPGLREDVGSPCFFQFYFDGDHSQKQEVPARTFKVVCKGSILWAWVDGQILLCQGLEACLKQLSTCLV